jgi:hypothetical protein
MQWRLIAMKKIFLIISFWVIGSMVFAQEFSIDGHLATDFEDVHPTLGLEINLNKIDILAGLSFWFYKNSKSYTNYQTFNANNTLNEYWIKFFAGIAPKVLLNDKLTLSFPLMVRIQFRNDSLKYVSDTVYTTTSPKKAEYFGYGFDTGARLYISLTDKWSVYTGAIMNVLYIHDNKYTYWKDSPTTTYTREDNGTSWFTDGNVELGVRFTF